MALTYADLAAFTGTGPCCVDEDYVDGELLEHPDGGIVFRTAVGNRVYPKKAIEDMVSQGSAAVMKWIEEQIKEIQIKPKSS